MEICDLVAANFHTGSDIRPMSTQAEDRYYASQIALPRLSPALLGSIATIAGMIMILGTGVIWSILPRLL